MSKFHFYRSSGSLGQILIGGLILVGLFLGLFWLARGVFTILSYVAPFMIIAAAIINYRVVTGYGQWLWSTLKRDPLMGVVYTALSFFGFPILAAYLLFKALAVKKIDKMREEQQAYRGPYRAFEPTETVEADFEIIEEEVTEIDDNDDYNSYEELFESK